MSLIFIRLFFPNIYNTVRDLAYRERVAAEILKTERDYVKNLDALIKVYLIPLSDLATSKKPVLTKEQIKGTTTSVYFTPRLITDRNFCGCSINLYV